MFDKTKNTIYFYCPDITIYNLGADLLYDFVNYLKSHEEYHVVILHSQEKFKYIPWKSQPNAEIKYLTNELVFDENDVLLFAAENLSLLLSTQNVRVRKIPIVTDIYSVVASALFTTKNTSAMKIEDFKAERIMVLEHPSIKGDKNIDEILRVYFMLDKDKITRVPFNYIDLDVYNNIMESITEPTVKELEDGKFTVEDVVTTKQKDIDVLIKIGQVTANAFIGYLVNNNSKGWVIDFIDYAVPENIRADKLKRAKVFVDFDKNSIDSAKAELCGCTVYHNIVEDMNDNGIQSVIDNVEYSLEIHLKDEYIKSLADAYSNINIQNFKEMIENGTCEQKKTD